MSAAHPVLRARGVNKSFGAVVAASDIAVDIARGERVSLIGSNGAGKTTFVNMITGYLKPDSGSIELDGRDVTPLHPRAISRLGVARSFQIPQLFPELSVLDNMLVATACQAGHFSFWHGAHRPAAVQRADALLARFGLADHRSRRVAELPGGVRKLLDIAMALTGQPKLLLLDEPTSGVSAEEKFPMMETIMTALGQPDPLQSALPMPPADGDRSAGPAESPGPLTVLFIEHDMDIVERYASRVVAFYAGRIIADAPPREALRSDDVRRYVTGELLTE